MDEKEQICLSLITWLETFSPEAPHKTIEDLSDGVAISQALTKIAPNYFTQAWLSKIKTDDLSNWRLKVTNLKKILKGILEFTLEVLGVTMQGFQMPDVNAIATQSSSQDLTRLLQLVLNVAINCDNKQEHIETIMGMEEAVQQSIMNAIQELMIKETVPAEDGESELQEQLKKTVEELNGALMAKEELLQRCHELDAQVASLQEERQNLSSDNERLQERLQVSENVDDPSTPAGKRCGQLQTQIELLQEELYKLESGKDDYRIKLDVLNKDYQDLKEKNAELNILAGESRAMKDELYILRETSDQILKHEATIESYKKKLEALADLQGQMKMLEEKNTKYMQQQIEMEEELKRVTSLKQQLESYKRQTMELQNKTADETKRADKAEFELKRIQDKNAMLQREKERIQAERDSLREMNEELECTRFQATGLGMAGELNEMKDGSADSVDMMSLPPQIKERLMRLEHENKILKMGSSSNQESQSTASQEQLDEANSKRNELETEVRLLNQRLMEIQAELEDSQENQRSASAASNNEVVSMRTQLSENKQKLEEKELLLQKKQQHISELDAKLQSSTERVSEVNELLVKKEEEIRLMEEKYRKYLEKAKHVIKSLDPRQSADSTAEVFALKNQVQEKDKYINYLEKDQEKNKSLRDQEEKLIVTAWYNLGMQLHRQAAEERLANSSVGQSFLARQRQLHSRRTTINSIHATNPSGNHESQFVGLKQTSVGKPRQALGKKNPSLVTQSPSSTSHQHHQPRQSQQQRQQLRQQQQRQQQQQQQLSYNVPTVKLSIVTDTDPDPTADFPQISPNYYSRRDVNPRFQ